MDGAENNGFSPQIIHFIGGCPFFFTIHFGKTPYFWKHPHLPSIFHTRPWTPPLCFARAECSATKRETLCGIEAECRTLKPGPRMDHAATHYRGNPVRFFLSPFFFVDFEDEQKYYLRFFNTIIIDDRPPNS